MFYDRYCELCQQKGVSPSRAAIEMGINKGTVSVWKNKGTHPQAAQLQKIADYFDVSVDYLLGMERDIFDGQGLVNGKNMYAASAIVVSKDDLDLNKKETPPAKPEGQEPSGQKTLSTEEKQHIKKYRLLNEAGKEKTDEYMEILLGNEDFKKGEKVLEVVARSGDHLQVSDNGALDDMVISYPDDL